jgi:hypothetical protein|tara:strand:- start:268 stop:630 length:363 start_codon:yes stop_codon:yes gene_type:complete
MNNFPNAHPLFIVDAPRSYDDLTKRQQEFVQMMHDAGHTGNYIRRPELKSVFAAANNGASFPWPSWLTGDKSRRCNRGVFFIPELAEYASNHAPEAVIEDDPAIALVDKAYVDPSYAEVS